MKLLGKAESVFEVSTRGTVIVPAWLSDVKVRNGIPIQLRSPNGSTTNTRIASVEMLKVAGGPCRAAFMLRPDIRKQELQEGSEIWISQEQGL